ncbi:hypothetical protein EJ110_NYTH32747 [Nymphaea thermarum]|nr:hypothetical protein EJ110_NYTH32747 [Nymphaea thermarum]
MSLVPDIVEIDASKIGDLCVVITVGDHADVYDYCFGSTLESSLKNLVCSFKMEKKTPPFGNKAAHAFGSPALYRTPERTPIPDCSSSFPPSPYVINHKRRGASLSRDSSLIDVAASCSKEKKKVEAGKEKSTVGSENNNGISIIEANGHQNDTATKEASEAVSVGYLDKETSTKDFADECWKDNSTCKELIDDEASAEDLPFCADKHGESEDFFYPQDSVSVSSSFEVEDQNSLERPCRNPSQAGEYYDAYEELSSDGASTPIPNTYSQAIQKELRAVRLDLLMEVEKRKQAEQTFDNMKNQWQRVHQELSATGILLPAIPAVAVPGNGAAEFDLAEELKQEVTVIRLVADAIGRGCARAEVEAEIGPKIESKDFEISRLRDRIQYYETVIHEMSRRNQEAVDMARRQRFRRMRRRKWIWCSVGLVATIGAAAAIAWTLAPRASNYWTSRTAVISEDGTAEKK